MPSYALALKAADHLAFSISCLFLCASVRARHHVGIISECHRKIIRVPACSTTEINHQNAPTNLNAVAWFTKRDWHNHELKNL